MRRIFYGILALTLLFASAAFAADVRVIASLDREETSVGRPVFLTVRVLDGRGSIQAPQIPLLRDLNIDYTGRSSRMSLINGVASSSLEFSFVVTPRKAGVFTIPPLQVIVGGAPFQTNAVRLDVVDDIGSPQMPPSRSSGQSYQSSAPIRSENVKAPAGSDPRIFVEAQLSKKSVYQNEQVVLGYVIYTDYEGRLEGFEKDPEFTGLWTEEIPVEKQPRPEMVTIGGRPYGKTQYRKFALFPTTPGKYTIPTGSIKAVVKLDSEPDRVFDEFFNDSFFNSGNFFSKRESRILTPKPVEIEVKPLPEEGKPQGFQGDVGSYQMSASLDKTEVTQNEPVKMTLVIEGTGNIDRVNRPRIPELKGFRVYEADSKSEISRQSDAISGRKTFEVVFIPRESGKMFIPPLEFSFFNPSTAQYQTLRTENYALNVLPGEEGPAIPEIPAAAGEDNKKAVQVEGGKDIQYIATRLPQGAGRNYSFWLVLLLGALNLAALGWLVFAVYQRNQESFISQNRGLYRTRRARNAAMVQIQSLKKLAHRKDAGAQTEFFELLERAMNQYFADKWDLSAYGITRSEIMRRLREILGEDELCQEVEGVYQLCDESRFGKGSIPESSKDLAVRIFMNAINRLEKLK